MERQHQKGIAKHVEHTYQKLTERRNKMETGIESRAMKFKLQRGGVRRSARDHEAEELVKQVKGDEGQVVSRKLFQNKKSPVYLYQQKANEMYQYHVSMTLPCGDDSTRLLKNSAYFEYTGKMSQLIQELESLKSKIVGTPEEYAAIVANDIVERNIHLAGQSKPATASEADYLSFTQMERRLYITWYAEPIATAGDFRFEVPADMKQALADQQKQMLVEAKEDIRQRMLSPLKAIVAKLSVPIGEEGAVFRNSLVTNLTDLVEQLPHLNLDDDPEINILMRELATIAIDPDMLRSYQGARDATANKAGLLVSKLTNGWKI